MKINLSELNIKKTHDLLTSGDISCRELCEFYLENIKKNDKDIHAYLDVFDDVYEQAESVDKKIKGGEKISPLAGMPVAVKDNILIKNKKCTAGSKILENYTAIYNATVIEKLKKEDVIFLGKTNLDEFAMGGSTEHSAFGPTKNPLDKTRVPGGSSGGSAAAVASNMCLGALGSDTGGSVRQPAAFCGVVGLKPTYGAVSRYGLIAMASSLDQIGPIGKSVEDVEIVFDAIKGCDPKDSTSVEPKIKNLKFLPAGRQGKIKNCKIGVPKEFFDLSGENKGIEPAVVDSFKKCVDFFKNEGFEVKEISIPALKYSLAVYYIIMPAEVSSNLARYEGVKYGFKKEGKNLLEDYLVTREKGLGDEARRRLLLGTYVLSAGYYDAYYEKAQKVRSSMKNGLADAYKEVDMIISPSVPMYPFKIGEKIDDPVQMYLADIFTVFANLTGVPALSVPIEQENKLPSGLQITAPWFEEKKLFEVGKLFESSFLTCVERS